MFRGFERQSDRFDRQKKKENGYGKGIDRRRRGKYLFLSMILKIYARTERKMLRRGNVKILWIFIAI